MKKDLNKIAKIEKAMSKKFGEESIVNPKSGWDDDKEKKIFGGFEGVLF